MIFYTADLHFLYEPLLSSRPFATVEEIRAAVTILALCTKLVSIEKLEKERS